MSIFAFIRPYQLLTFKKKVTFCQLFSRPGPCDPYVVEDHIILLPNPTKVMLNSVGFWLDLGNCCDNKYVSITRFTKLRYSIFLSMWNSLIDRNISLT